MCQITKDESILKSMKITKITKQFLYIVIYWFSTGMGIAVNLINFHLNVYYAVILAWSLRYFVASMASELPWATCNNPWNTENCFDYKKGAEAALLMGRNATNATGITNITVSSDSVTSVQEFWE